MPVRLLPADANLHHLRYQARDLLREHAARLPEAAQRIREFHPGFKDAADKAIFGAHLRLSDAQLTVAREHGYPSWARLKRQVEEPTAAGQNKPRHHERIEDPMFRRAVDLLDGGDAGGLEAMLAANPQLIHQHVYFEGGNYFRSPTLLEFVAENPVRHGRLPANVVEVARVILNAKPDIAARNEALMLVATGSVARECGMQIALIDLLCEYEASADSAIHAAAVLNEHGSVEALIEHGAKVDLPVAAALGRVTEFERCLATASPKERHLALAMATQFGRAEMVRALLDAGEDPNRYNPTGGHSHATPLHQAAAAGDEVMVELLVERGARLDRRDVLWRATPAEWARHEGKTVVEQYLRAEESRREAEVRH